MSAWALFHELFGNRRKGERIALNDVETRTRHSYLELYRSSPCARIESVPPAVGRKARMHAWGWGGVRDDVYLKLSAPRTRSP